MAYVVNVKLLEFRNEAVRKQLLVVHENDPALQQALSFIRDSTVTHYNITSALDGTYTIDIELKGPFSTTES